MRRRVSSPQKKTFKRTRLFEERSSGKRKRKQNPAWGGTSLAAGGRITIVQNDAARVFFSFFCFWCVQPLPGERRVLEKRRVFFQRGVNGVKKKAGEKNPSLR